MERNWERAHDFLELSAEAIEERLRPTMPGARLISARPLDAGLRNTNYRLEIEGEPSPMVLRLYVADPAACMVEHPVLEKLYGRVPVPWIYAVDSTADPPFMLLRWIEGRRLDELLSDCDAITALELAASCGTALAAIHETRFPAPGFLGVRGRELTVVRPMPAWAPAVLAALEGPAGGRLGPDLAARVRQAVESNAPEVEPAWSDAVLAHGDFKPWNLLARAEDGAWRVSGVLDWEFACAATPLLDFATFLRDEQARPAGFGDAFATAYRAAGGALPNGWRRLTRLVDLLNLLQLLEWSGEHADADLHRLVRETLDAL
jgi:aminoglycoside phosphotransferase (APT) family kinase protein